MTYETIFKGIMYVLYIYLGFIALCLILYLPRLIGWFAPLRKQKHLEKMDHFRIAVLVPARNESSVVGGLLDDLDEQTYPKEFFDVHVIVKDPNDKTLAIAKGHNAITHIVEDQKRKSDALNSCIQDIFKKNGKDYYDAYLIMDADCWMDKKCLEEINNGFASGRHVVQCKKIVKNYYMDNKEVPLEASCNGIIWTLIDEMGNRFKSDHNIASMTIGTGICFRKDVIKQIGGWPYNKTLTEDIEFMYDAILRGFDSYYSSYAKIYMEEADTLEMTNKRRQRWMSGVCDSKKYYNTRLSDECITPKEKINRYYSKALWIVYWMIGISALHMVLNFILGTVLLVFMSNLSLWAYLSSFIGFSVIYFSFFFMTLCAIIIDHKYIKMSFFGKIKLLLVHPFFYMGYIKIVFKALFVKNEASEWDAIARVEDASGKK
jgi:Glycosyltransferases, probably involved in cell wall biogenesis